MNVLFYKFCYEIVTAAYVKILFIIFQFKLTRDDIVDSINSAGLKLAQMQSQQ